MPRHAPGGVCVNHYYYHQTYPQTPDSSLAIGAGSTTPSLLAQSLPVLDTEPAPCPDTGAGIQMGGGARPFRVSQLWKGPTLDIRNPPPNNRTPVEALREAPAPAEAATPSSGGGSGISGQSHLELVGAPSIVTPAKAGVQRGSWEALPKLALSEMRLPCIGGPNLTIGRTTFELWLGNP